MPSAEAGTADDVEEASNAETKEVEGWVLNREEISFGGRFST